MQIYAVLAAIPSVLESMERVMTHISDALALLLELDQLLWRNDGHVQGASLSQWLLLSCSKVQWERDQLLKQT